MIAERHSSLAACLRYAGVTVGPIKAISGIRVCFAALDNEERAVAVVLDFVDPPARGGGWSTEVASCGLMKSSGMRGF